VTRTDRIPPKLWPRGQGHTE